MNCVGCAAIANQGGGQWKNGEPHYVGCPTELAELREKCRKLDELEARMKKLESALPVSPLVGEPVSSGFYHAKPDALYPPPSMDGLSSLSAADKFRAMVARAGDLQLDSGALAGFTPKKKRRERIIDRLRRVHGGTWTYDRPATSSPFSYLHHESGRRVFVKGGIPQFEDGPSEARLYWENGEPADYTNDVPTDP